jgi:hypothetical protein
MPKYLIDPLLQQIRARALELRQLEGDGVDEVSLAAHRREVERLAPLLASAACASASST